MSDFEKMDEMDEMDNIISLTDEDGTEVPFEFLDLVEYEGKEYVILLPFEDEESEEDDEVIILEVRAVESDDELEEYASVDDEDILNAVFEIFKERFKDDFDFT